MTQSLQGKYRPKEYADIIGNHEAIETILSHVADNGGSYMGLAFLLLGKSGQELQYSCPVLYGDVGGGRGGHCDSRRRIIPARIARHICLVLFVLITPIRGTVTAVPHNHRKDVLTEWKVNLTLPR